MIQASKILKIEKNLAKKKKQKTQQIKLIIKKENRATQAKIKIIRTIGDQDHGNGLFHHGHRSLRSSLVQCWVT